VCRLLLRRPEQEFRCLADLDVVRMLRVSDGAIAGLALEHVAAVRRRRGNHHAHETSFEVDGLGAVGAFLDRESFAGLAGHLEQLLLELLASRSRRARGRTSRDCRRWRSALSRRVLFAGDNLLWKLNLRRGLVLSECGTARQTYSHRESQ